MTENIKDKSYNLKVPVYMTVVEQILKESEDVGR